MNRFQTILTLIVIFMWCVFLSTLNNTQKDYIYNILVMIVFTLLIIGVYGFYRYEKSKPVNNKSYRYKYTTAFIVMIITLIMIIHFI